ncbi:helix-turn-helix domain-containing protein [Saccharothrix sp. ALI-22-I]|uniref:helix-turn-helix domain-containing protein n=1 Tax=Saccharothrix sp. ALI-22-I TaxID=1933778 RepID=UPI001EE6AD0B|nr:helix-turn-helix domain-containing protein [Saccharothrix sp. ALI-22-I]
MADKNIKPVYLSVGDAAARLSVSEATIRRAVRSGELAHVRIGRAVRVAVTDLDAYAAARRVVTEAGESR